MAILECSIQLKELKQFRVDIYFQLKESPPHHPIASHPKFIPCLVREPTNCINHARANNCFVSLWALGLSCCLFSRRVTVPSPSKQWAPTLLGVLHSKRHANAGLSCSLQRTSSFWWIDSGQIGDAVHEWIEPNRGASMRMNCLRTFQACREIGSGNSTNVYLHVLLFEGFRNCHTVFENCAAVFYMLHRLGWLCDGGIVRSWLCLFCFRGFVWFRHCSYEWKPCWYAIESTGHLSSNLEDKT